MSSRASLCKAIVIQGGMPAVVAGPRWDGNEAWLYNYADVQSSRMQSCSSNCWILLTSVDPLLP